MTFFTFRGPARLGLLLAAFALLCSAAPVAAQPAKGPSFSVSGQVQDRTGGMLRGADITLRPSTDGATTPRQAKTDEAGRFTFDGVPAGSFELRAEFPGFEPSAVHLVVGPRSPGRQRLVLDIAGLQQEVTVGTSSADVSTTSSENRDALALDKQMLRDMPSFDGNVVDAAAAFLDPGAGGTGGTTLVVDGMEARKAGVSASAIEQIKINQDPYAAEYARPGGGRIEVITKSGADAYHGEFNAIFRHGSLNARDPFSETAPTGERRIFEGSIGGPVGDGRVSSFLFTMTREATDDQAIVFAQGPSGPVRASVPTPARNLELSATLNRQVAKVHNLSFRATYQTESSRNDNVGGTSLPEVATNAGNREAQFILGHRAVLAPTLVHQFRLLVAGDHQTDGSVTQGRRLVVQDAFTGGGGQVNMVQEERHFTLTETLTWSHKRHTLKAGLNVPDWSRRYANDRGNTDGTFSFSSLNDFAAGKPYSFTAQQGNGELAFMQKMVGVFVQDDVAVRPSLSVAVGLRYDWQNFVSDNNNVAPRASFAWAPGHGRKTVFRGGVGIFYDRIGARQMRDVISSDQGQLRRFTILDPGYPDPLSHGTIANESINLVRISPTARMPYTAQFGIGVERQLAKALTLAANYTGARGVALFGSRDVNAPLPPFYAGRPDASHGVIREIESTGRQWSHSMQVTLRGRVNRQLSGSVQYVLSRAMNDTAGINAFPANDYSMDGEWSRADFDQRHRVDVVGAYKAGRWATVGVSASLRSSRPYTMTTGRDEYQNGRTNARPAGVSRNTLDGPSFARVDLRVSRAFDLGLGAKKDDGPKVAVGVDAFNVLNRVNYSGYVGNMSSPFFGIPIGSSPARRLQLSARFEF